MNDKPTICVQCLHHRNTSPYDTDAGPAPDTWYYQMCGCRETFEVVPFDFVLGIQSEPQPRACRDVNNGECKYWEKLP